ncbi:DUF2169 domain-containing protein, partial [bacterium]|nr:DUF2169 domain-containing protein [candidate division CSSED10-310 bacterium]
PNLEDPDHPIEKWNDAPDPLCWATMPLTSSLHAQRTVNTQEQSFLLSEHMYARAHPSLVFNRLPKDTPITIRGVHPDKPLSFQVPDLSVTADFLLDNRHVCKQLACDTLVILAEEFRFYCVYRLLFNYLFEPGGNRAVRLTVENQPPDSIGT